jgi:hypothetical protein
MIRQWVWDMNAVCGTNERDKIGFVHLYSLHMNLMAREA